MNDLKNVWITFDDGPHPQHTSSILRTLAVHKIKATFFPVGFRAQHCMELVKKIADHGHEIGNHTFSHPDLTRLSSDGVRQEIVTAEELLGPYLSQPKLFRPPYGYLNKEICNIVSALGYKILMWSADTEDWKVENKPAGWVKLGAAKVRQNLKPVVLMHDIHETTSRHLKDFLDCISAADSLNFVQARTLLRGLEHEPA